MAEMTDFNIEMARANLQKRRQATKERNKIRFESATQDCKKIIKMLISEYKPRRIYQWGSLLHENEFSEISDIDIAIEADWDPHTFFTVLGKAQEMTKFPLDLVELDKIHPLHAADIRSRGRLIYESD
jgi:predicted nucleotidyltransferase